MISPDSTIALPARIPIIAFEVTDLPEPDSPNYGEGFALIKIKADVSYCLKLSVIRTEGYSQVFYK